MGDAYFKSFENYAVKLSAKETKWTSLELRTHPTFIETSISNYSFFPFLYLLSPYRGMLVCNICVISISNSVSDVATNKSLLNIERSQYN